VGPNGDESLLPVAKFFWRCSECRSLMKRECLTPSQQPCNYSVVILPERFPGLQVRDQKNRAQRANSSRDSRGHDKTMTVLPDHTEATSQRGEY
jgi:hypothetical protein